MRVGVPRSWEPPEVCSGDSQKAPPRRHPGPAGETEHAGHTESHPVPTVAPAPPPSTGGTCPGDTPEPCTLRHPVAGPWGEVGRAGGRVGGILRFLHISALGLGLRGLTPRLSALAGYTPKNIPFRTLGSGQARGGGDEALGAAGLRQLLSVQRPLG